LKTLGELREWTKELPDDYEIWIEYPTILRSHVKEDIICDGDHRCIDALSIARDDNKKRVYILHHY